MDEHRMKVLELLSEGKITVDEAEKLLDRLGRGTRKANQRNDAGSPSEVDAVRGAKATGPRYLRVIVKCFQGNNVNVRVPLSFVRTGVNLSALLPEEARRRLEEHGVDLGKLYRLKDEQLVEALSELDLKFNALTGDKIKIFCE